jgi:hypothetical protein
MNSHLSDLKKITTKLLADESSYGEIRQACLQLLQFFYDITGFDENDPHNNRHIKSRVGQAVSPQAAAVCIRDFMRTRVFMRGLKEAVLTRLHASPGKPVTVLYAGTGPFASLLIPLATLFDATQLNMLLLDINPISIACLKRVIAALGLEPYVAEVVEADAVTYTVPETCRPGIILSETMMPSLKKEPQVSISANLVSQCPQAILIPQMIEVSAVLYSGRTDVEKRFIHLKSLLVINKEAAAALAMRQQTEAELFPAIELPVEEPPEPYYSRLALVTDIRVFNNETLGFNESSLTIREIMYDLHTIKSWPALFTLQYRLFPEPGFVIAAR